MMKKVELAVVVICILIFGMVSFVLLRQRVILPASVDDGFQKSYDWEAMDESRKEGWNNTVIRQYDGLQAPAYLLSDYHISKRTAMELGMAIINN